MVYTAHVYEYVHYEYISNLYNTTFLMLNMASIYSGFTRRVYL